MQRCRLEPSGDLERAEPEECIRASKALRKIGHRRHWGKAGQSCRFDERRDLRFAHETCERRGVARVKRVSVMLGRRMPIPLSHFGSGPYRRLGRMASVASVRGLKRYGQIRTRDAQAMVTARVHDHVRRLRHVAIDAQSTRRPRLVKVMALGVKLCG